MIGDGVNPHPPAAVALGDQLHTEFTQRGNAGARDLCARHAYRPSVDEQMLIDIGVQAGLHAALTVLVEHGWIRIEVQP